MKKLLTVLRFFVQNPGKLFICAEVARDLNLPERNVSNYLRTLTDTGFLRKEARAYRLNGAMFVQGVQSIRSITKDMAHSI